MILHKKITEHWKDDVERVITALGDFFKHAVKEIFERVFHDYRTSSLYRDLLQVSDARSNEMLRAIERKFHELLSYELGQPIAIFEEAKKEESLRVAGELSQQWQKEEVRRKMASAANSAFTIEKHKKVVQSEVKQKSERMFDLFHLFAVS